MIDRTQLQYKNKNIRLTGCYFLSLLIETEKVYDEEEVLKLYNKFVDEKWMRDDCYILDPICIVKFLKINPLIGYVGGHFVNLSKNCDPLTLRPPTQQILSVRDFR